MSVAEKLTNKLYKWVVLYPGFRKFINWAYSDLMKMPQYHIDLAPCQIGQCVILVDDPLDAEKVAAYFDDAQEVACHREYRTFTGHLFENKVSVTSTGIGGPPAAIGVHELATIGAETFVYLGNSFAPVPPANEGDFILPTGCVRDEGTGLQYTPLAFPAISDIRVTEAIRHVCKEAGTMVHLGLIRSTDSYYNITREKNANFPYILAADMNTASIFITSSVLKKHAGALLLATNRIQPLQEHHIKLGISSLKQLIRS